MILVAFVLVLVATVMLIIGTFFNAGVAYIWISIAACVATFVVLGISYAARRRNADAPAMRPGPLAEGTSRGAATRTAPRAADQGPATTAADDAATGADARVTVVPHRPAEAAQDETRVLDPVPAPSEAQPEPEPAAWPEAEPESEPASWPEAEEPAVAEDTPAEDAPAEEPAPSVAGADEPAVDEPAVDEPVVEDVAEEPTEQPAPRRVAPRRVVRRAAPAAATEGAAAAAGATPAAGATSAPRVVRRAAAGEGTQAGRAPVRRDTGEQGQQRVVRRVVRRPAEAGEGQQAPPASTSAAGQPAASPSPAPAAGGRSGTRGKRARAVLSEIKGVGPAKQDALLKRFGSLEEMASASIEDLSAVKGVGPNVAQQIKQVLQDR